MKNKIKSESRFWNSFSAKYDRFINRTLGPTYRQLYKMLKTDILGSDKVLEVATGTGLLAFEICSYVNSIIAIDIAPEMIRIARQKQQINKIENIEFQICDSCILEFEDNSFEVVIASNVLHLLFNAEKSLSEIHRVLKNGGIAILPTFCHAENIQSRIISGFMSLFGFKARNKWSVKSYTTFIENNGFIITKAEVIPGKIPLMYCLVKQRI